MQEEDQILLRVRAYADTHALLPEGGTVLAAVSGGPDSVVLLDLLKRLSKPLNLSVQVAHLDHQLRPQSSGDREFVETLARDRRLTFHGAKAAVSERAQQNRESLEEAGRAERRDFLSRVAREIGADRIALGHHLDDQAETVLMRLTRGAGLSGLAGIRPISQGCWIHPLLCLSRTEILAYADRHGLTYVTDASNDDIRHLRNRIRHHIIPGLKRDVNDAASRVIARTADLLRCDDECLDQTAIDTLKTVTCVQTERKIALDGNACFRYHVAIQRRVFRLAASQLGMDLRKLNAARLIDALEQFNSGPARVDLTTDLTACFDGRLIVLGRQVDPFDRALSSSGTTEAPEIGATLVASSTHSRPTDLRRTDPFTAWFDPARLSSLRLRSVKPGDRIAPFGFSGTVKISKLLIDRKVPKIVRDEVPVVVSGDDPIWVVGLRTSARAPVDPEAGNAVRLEFSGDWRKLATALKLPSPKALSNV